MTKDWNYGNYWEMKSDRSLETRKSYSQKPPFLVSQKPSFLEKPALSIGSLEECGKLEIFNTVRSQHDLAI
ncbi:MAG: hypothetical protein SXA11_26010 [Cyanobacteriota bacterium]|nr:hypothetical protein [Cyanobacteriota bacterium]